MLGHQDGLFHIDLSMKLASSKTQPFGKKLGFFCAAQILILAVVIFVGEILIRTISPNYALRGKNERSFFAAFDPLLGWSPKKNFTGVHEKDGFSIPIHQNRFGLRAPDSLTKKKDSGKKRILVLGDSYVWGYGSGDDELFTRSSQNETDPFELVNLGVSGYGTDQEFLFYKGLGTEFEADEVALIFTVNNDFTNNKSRSQYGYPKPFFTIDGKGLELHTNHIRKNELLGARDWIRTRFFFINYLDRQIRRIRTYLENRLKDSREPRRKDRPIRSKKDEAALELTARIVRELKTLVESEGKRFYVVFVPFKLHIKERVDFNHPMVQHLANRLRREAIEYREPYFLFLNLIRKGETLFKRDHHFNGAGNALFRKLLTHPKIFKETQNYYHPSHN